MEFTSQKKEIDTTRREIKAEIKTLKFKDRNSQFRILAGVVDGEKLTIKCTEVVDLPIYQDNSYRFFGKFVNDPRWGWQFKAESYIPYVAPGREGTLVYLQKFCHGIGEQRAAKLWDRYGAETVEVVRTQPQRTIDDGILTEQIATEASKSLQSIGEFESTKIELFELLAGRGFQIEKVIGEVLAKWRHDAPAKIRRSPYRLLLDGVTSCGWKRVDQLYLDLGHDRDALKRRFLAGWYSIDTDRGGHTWFAAKDLLKRIADACGGSVNDPLSTRAVRLGLRAKWLSARRDAKGDLFFASKDKAAAEETIASAIANLNKHGKAHWPAINYDDERLKLSDHQKEALRTVTSGPVAILAGTPGTGKTFSTAELVKACVREVGRDKVVVCAPTGKAAVRCSQSLSRVGIDIVARTIHKVLIENCGGFEWAKRKQLDAKYIFVDESSMIDTDLAARLFGVIPADANVLLIGDPYQLPPVGHGAPLRDLIRVAAAGGGQVKYFELTQIQRNAGAIVRACRAIKDGEKYHACEAVDMDSGENLIDVPAGDFDESVERVIQVIDYAKQFNMDPIWSVQVLVALNDHRHKINDLLQEQLNPEGQQADGCPFRVGDKVINLKNSEFFMAELVAGEWVEAKDEVGIAAKLWVANGEIGKVLFVSSQRCVISVDGGIIAVPLMPPAKLKDGEEADNSTGRQCSWDLAFACTCHKLQGSDAATVVIVAARSAGTVASREWWYTAISRAAKLCFVIGDRGIVNDQARKPSADRRRTFLGEIVSNATPKPE